MIRFARHVILSLAFALLAALCVPLARVRFRGPILWALEAHEYHLRRAVACARGEV